MRSELLPFLDEQWIVMAAPHSSQHRNMCHSMGIDQYMQSFDDIEHHDQQQETTSSSSNTSAELAASSHNHNHHTQHIQYPTSCLRNEAISSSSPLDDFLNCSSIDPSFLDPIFSTSPLLINTASGGQYQTVLTSMPSIDVRTPSIIEDDSNPPPTGAVACSNASIEEETQGKLQLVQPCMRQQPPWNMASRGHAQTSMKPPKFVSRSSNQDPFLASDSHPTSMSRGGSGTGAASMAAGISIVKGLGSLGGSPDASCMEQLLVHCATAVESNDATVAQQLMWVLNNIVSVEGDPNQRVTAYFLRALMARAARMAPNMATSLQAAQQLSRVNLSAIELAGFVDITPWHRFGFCAANGAIVEALEGISRVHILDFSITHCMQWPTLIEALSKRPEGAPHVRLTVHGGRPPVPPLLSVSCEQVGAKLASFARCKNVPFQFRVVSEDMEHLNADSLELHPGEALVVNCQMRLHYLPEETLECSHRQLQHQRAQFLRLIRGLRPTILTFVDEDANLTHTSLVERLRTAFNYMWIPFDALETFLPRDSEQRLRYEADVGSKIENVISCEGPQRIERLECKERWMQRLRGAHLQSIPFSEGVIAEVKSMLEEHAAGWGLKKDGDALLLTWKGHNAVFATSCIASIPPNTTS